MLATSARSTRITKKIFKISQTNVCKMLDNSPIVGYNAVTTYGWTNKKMK